VVLTAKPAAENTGIIVRRVDLESENEIPALAENVAATERGTVLMKGEAKVSTIEHCMAALYAAGVDNCVLEVNAPEFPILDGSARPYIEAINSVGLEEQSAEKEYYEVTSKKSFYFGRWKIVDYNIARYRVFGASDGELRLMCVGKSVCNIGFVEGF
jgi:UDP-3-O-[3-hydroxymyristoyl] N-acetylglucosamine deacetylase/3-hydroxyacyl-[acyl-carrier-protein] dehydratase